MPPRLDIDVGRIAELYEQGFSAKQIAQMLDLSKPTVLKKLHERGVELRRGIDIPNEKFADLYEQGLSLRKISKIFNCSSSTVLERLRKLGVKLRPKSRARKLPELKPHWDLAYVLGVTFGDGWREAWRLSLQVKDRDFAEAFALAWGNLGFEPKTSMKNGGYYRVDVNSVELIRWLGSLSYEKIWELFINDETRRAFIRGYFDSDGGVVNQNEIRFSSLDLPLLKLVAKICSNLGIETTIRGPYREKYELYVRAKSKVLFAKLIGSSFARKREALEKIARFYS